jgi:rRNA maturation endonuclease Nob1
MNEWIKNLLKWRLSCLQCGAIAALVRVNLDERQDKVTFRCDSCGHDYVVLMTECQDSN